MRESLRKRRKPLPRGMGIADRRSPVARGALPALGLAVARACSRLRQGREKIPVTFDPVENLARAEPQAVRVTALLAVSYLIPGDWRGDSRVRATAQ